MRFWNIMGWVALIMGGIIVDAQWVILGLVCWVLDKQVKA